MTRVNDLSRSFTVLDQDSTLIAVIEMSLKSWLVGGIVPGLAREPLKKLEADPEALLEVLYRWRAEAVKAGKTIGRIAVAYEAGRDGFWLARWLQARGIEAYVMHAASIAVSREHRRAKTDRLDVALLKRSFLGWLRGEAKHCQMVAVPSVEQEDGRRPGRERDGLMRERTRIVNRLKSTLARCGIRGFNPKLRRAGQKLAELRTPEGVGLAPHTLAEVRRDLQRLALVREQLKEIEREREQQLKVAPSTPAASMVAALAQVIGIGPQTADLLVQEIFCRNLRDRRALARYAGLTGSPDESGSRRREKGLARAGNARVRTAMIQLAWRFTSFQKNSALVQWYEARTADSAGRRKPMIVALARKLLIELWRYATLGLVPQGVALRPAA